MKAIQPTGVVTIPASLLCAEFCAKFSPMNPQNSLMLSFPFNRLRNLKTTTLLVSREPTHGCLIHELFLIKPCLVCHFLALPHHLSFVLISIRPLIDRVEFYKWKWPRMASQTERITAWQRQRGMEVQELGTQTVGEPSVTDECEVGHL